MDILEKKLGYEFSDRELLVKALTHSSYANENRRSCSGSNERLEFLGDSILGFVVADYLYRGNPDMPEGQMTRIRAELVCEDGLAGAAEKLDLGMYLRLGKGEQQNGGRGRKTIIADATESVIAAVYLDGGLEAAKDLIYRLILIPSENGARYSKRDYKTDLQEFVQQKGGNILKYDLLSESGPDHDKVFNIGVYLNGEYVASGTGKSKKEAEQDSARRALEALKK